MYPYLTTKLQQFPKYPVFPFNACPSQYCQLSLDSLQPTHLKNMTKYPCTYSPLYPTASDLFHTQFTPSTNSLKYHKSIQLHKPHFHSTKHTFYTHMYYTSPLAPFHFSKFSLQMFLTIHSLVGIAGTILTTLTPSPHPSTLIMASNDILADSFGISTRQLRSTTSRKKKLSLKLDSLKLVSLLSVDPDPSGPIAIWDFPPDCRQLPPRQTVGSNLQLMHSSQSLSKKRPRPEIEDDSDDSQTYSSRAPIKLTTSATTSRPRAASGAPINTPLPTS
jgi:hypothetical protein